MLVSLGKVDVAAPGTPERLTKNRTDPTEEFPVHAVLAQVLPGNKGNVYIGVAGMDRTSLAGVVAILPIPTVNLLATFSASISYAVAGLQADEIWVDADQSGDGVVAGVVVP
jgi:hypothetical protein